MEFKGLPANLSLKEIDGRSVIGIPAVIGNIDSGHDRISKNAFKKSIKEGTDRVRHLWQHDSYSPPIAVIKSLREIGLDELPEKIKNRFPDAIGGLEVTREYLNTPKGDEVLEGIRAGAINEMSFAYDALKFDFEEIETPEGKYNIRNLKELRLWDTSDVNWGMNPATSAVKSALPFRDNGISQKDLEWKSPTLEDFTDREIEDLEEKEIRRIMAHFAYSKSDPLGDFSDLRLAHHKPEKQGIGVAVLKGVISAMAYLMDGDIPEKDLGDSYDHLAKHYDQFGIKAPDLKLVNLYRSAKNVRSAGLEIIGLEPLIGSLKGLIAEPISEPSPESLTIDILTRIAIAEREIYL